MLKFLIPHIFTLIRFYVDPVLDIKKELKLIVSALLISSGYQDSNLGPPAPKAGALTGLRYTPFLLSLSVDLFLNCDAKVRLIFELPNF